MSSHLPENIQSLVLQNTSTARHHYFDTELNQVNQRTLIRISYIFTAIKGILKSHFLMPFTRGIHPFSSLTLLKTMSYIHRFFVEILPNGVTECVTQLQIAYSIALFHPSRFSIQQYHLHCCREFAK